MTDDPVARIIIDEFCHARDEAGCRAVAERIKDAIKQYGLDLRRPEQTRD